MLIILEGPDGAGKSFLAEALVRLMGTKVVIHHHGPYKNLANPADRYLESIQQALHGVPVVMDRSWLSEPIYGRAYRGGQDRVGVAYRRMLERLAISTPCLLVRCLPPWGRVSQTFEDRQAEEYLDTPHELRRVYQLYQDELRSLTDLPMWSFDYTKDDLHQFVANAVAYLHSLRDYLGNMGPGIGNWSPGKVDLLVGERANQSNGVEGYPFVSLHRGRSGCSAWLADRLDEAGVREPQLYWVNAYGPDGLPVEPGFIAHLRPRRIFALGRQATRYCREVAGLDDHEFIGVPHPQYWKRFHTHETYPLIKELSQ